MERELDRFEVECDNGEHRTVVRLRSDSWVASQFGGLAVCEGNDHFETVDGEPVSQVPGGEFIIGQHHARKL